MIIGLHGKARAGKDTAWGFLEEAAKKAGYQTHHVSFARSLKASALASLGLDSTEIGQCEVIKDEGRLILSLGDEVHQISGREFLQYYGTEAHRSIFGQNFWVDQVLPPDYFDPEHVVTGITDVRFENEAERVHELGGQVWAISRPSVAKDGDSHASEANLPAALIDFEIVNDGSLESFQAKVEHQLIKNF